MIAAEYYCVIHRPECDVSTIDNVDAKYNPYHGLVAPHVTLMFPMPARGLEEQDLIAHISSVSSKTRPFSVRINETELSWDQWLFLVPTEGRDEFNLLHDELYSGALERFWRKDLSYSPHVGVGHFGVGAYNLKTAEALPIDQSKYDQALADIKEAKIDLQYSATKIELIGLDADYLQSWGIKEFSLGEDL